MLLLLLLLLMQALELLQELFRRFGLVGVLLLPLIRSALGVRRLILRIRLRLAGRRIRLRLIGRLIGLRLLGYLGIGRRLIHHRILISCGLLVRLWGLRRHCCGGPRGASGSYAGSGG